jgi:thymidylate synthase (FAD)|nr:MAG TPA: Thymidylate synthase complementing protein [Caudoviricetes sp.]
MPTAELISATHEPLELLKKAAGQCYQREATDATIKHIIEAGHLSVLEHAYASFAVSCSLTVLLQLTRHRHLSFTVQSSRGTLLDDLHETGILQVDAQNRGALHRYHQLASEGYRKDDLAYILPKGITYHLVVTGNFRAWFEYLPKRLCQRATAEHRELAKKIHHFLCLLCPEVFCRVQLPCTTCKERSCAFSD